MYAGNHSPCHPLETLLRAAADLRSRSEIVFLFVGGGSEMARVKDFAETHQLKNIRCLKYQPQEDLAAVLSAADLHAIVLGEGFTGIVHPSKIYNIMGVQSPFIYVGPGESHVSDIIERLGNDEIAMTAAHGEAHKVARQIPAFADRAAHAAAR